MPKLYKVMNREGKIILSRKKGRYAGWNGGKKDRLIFGRLDCKTGMRMLKKNRVFFHRWDDAIAAGFRPCKLCRPQPD